MQKPEKSFATGLKCPICHTPLAFGDQMAEWDLEYGDETNENNPWLGIVNIHCFKCELATVSVDINATGINLPKKIQEKILKDIEKIKKEKN